MTDTSDVLTNTGTFCPILKCISISQTGSKMLLSFLMDLVCLHVHVCFMLRAVSVSLVLVFFFSCRLGMFNTPSLKMSRYCTWKYY